MAGLSEILWLGFHIIMGWPSAILVSALTIIRNILGSKAQDAIMRPATLSILLLTALIMLSQAYAWQHLLPLLAAGIDTLSIWWRDHPLFFRLGLIASETAWLVFSLFLLSWPNLLCSLFAILITLYKIHSTHIKSFQNQHEL